MRKQFPMLTRCFFFVTFLSNIKQINRAIIELGTIYLLYIYNFEKYKVDKTLPNSRRRLSSHSSAFAASSSS